MVEELDVKVCFETSECGFYFSDSDWLLKGISHNNYRPDPQALFSYRREKSVLV